jgi:hypothetical protein
MTDDEVQREVIKARVVRIERFEELIREAVRKERIRGLRIRLQDVREMLAAGASPAEILADYPYLTAEDIEAAQPPEPK